jgi:hypothetical protein
MKYLIALLFSCCLISGAVQAQQEMQLPLQEFVRLQAEFTQERRLAALPVPLRARGEVLLSREMGVRWHQQQPFGMTLWLTDTAMLQQLDGEAVQPLSDAGDPRMQAFQRLLRDLLLVDLAALADDFQITSLPASGSSWQLQLVPKTAPLNLLFSHFELSGSQVVETLHLLDRDGDAILIRFSDHQWSNEPLTDEERGLFHP